MSELIERIERAREGSRELDAAIYQILNSHMLPTPGKIGSFYDPTKAGPIAAAKYHISGGATGVAKFYTTSIDAAMTLLPEGLGNGCFFLQRSRSFGCIADVWTDTEFNRYKKGKGKTPALALCAAALRTRETSSGSPLSYRMGGGNG